MPPKDRWATSVPWCLKTSPVGLISTSRPKWRNATRSATRRVCTMQWVTGTIGLSRFGSGTCHLDLDLDQGWGTGRRGT
ncbi:hypothetical protein N8I71_10765 [Roseibacterium sp. SDUM158016]|nr:hypothetical protein [Roseibacterium sp. SDUM158016]